VLGSFDLQVAAVVALVVTLGVVGAGLARRTRFPRNVRVVARREPPRWTEFVWVLGSLLAVFWPVGFLLFPKLASDWPAVPDFAGSWLVQLLGMVVVAGGAVLFSRAARALGSQLTPAIQVQEGHRLLQEGPYRRIRHPMYTAILTIGLGQTMLFLSPLAALLTLLLVVLAVYRARLEESLLSSPEAFGRDYDLYAARTGRFLPRLRAKP